jgi:hypothetical protein
VVAGAAFFAAAPASAASNLSLSGETSVNTLDLGSAASLTAATGAVHPNQAANEFGVTVGSTAITSAATHFSTTLDVGATVTGTGVPAGTVIVSVTDTGNAVLSKAATATNGSVTVTRNLQGTLLDKLLQPSFGLRVTNSVSSPVWVKLISAPSDTARLWIDDTASSTAVPAGGSDKLFAMTVGGTDGSSNTATQIHKLNGQNDRVYLAPGAAGAYTVQLFEDVDNSGSLTDADNTSSIVTLNARHVASASTAATTPSTWRPTVSAPSIAPLTQTVTTSVDLSDVTLTDTRGSGAIGTALANLIGIGWTGASAGHPQAAAGVASFSGTTAYKTSGTATTASEAVTSFATFDLNGGGTWDAYGSETNDAVLGTSSTTVSPDNASAITLEEIDEPGKVDYYNSQVVIKGGQAVAQYKATATSGGTGVDRKSVVFTLQPSLGTSTSSLTCSTSLTDLTTDGTLLTSWGSGVKQYQVLTNGSGVATLSVRSSDTTAGCPGYSVTAAVGHTSAVSGVLNAKYVVAAPVALDIANTTGELLPALGTSKVTLKASLVDQFGVSVAPPGTATQQAGLTVGSTTANVAWNGSAFSYEYVPATVPTAASTTPFTWTYSGASVAPKSGNITWVNSAVAGDVALNTPTDGGSNVHLSSSIALAPGQGSITLRNAVAGTTTTSVSSFGEPAGQVTGIVTGTSGGVLAYKKVTLAGSDGVYFSTSSTGAAAFSKTLDVVTNASGQFSGAYAFFTKAGTAKVTATADTKTGTSTVTTDYSQEPYIVSVNDAFGTPGSAITVSGKVVDVFGNAVRLNKVDVAVSPSGSGSITSGYTGGYATTDNDGVWSVQFTPSGGIKQDFTVTATMYSKTASLLSSNPQASTSWKDVAGVSGLLGGQFEDTAKLTVGPIILSGPTSREGSGFVRLIGVANPNTSVEIYGRVNGSSAGLVLVDTVMSDSKGDFQSSEYVTGTTLFVAKASSQYSPSVTVLVTGHQSENGGGGTAPKPVIKAFGAKAAGKGVVTLTVIGNGDTRSKVTVYILSGKTYKVVKTYNVDKKGVARATIKTGKGTKTFKIVYKNDTKTVTKIYKVKVK